MRDDANLRIAIVFFLTISATIITMDAFADSNPAYLQKPSPSPDLDNDGDVDMDDFGIFQRCASGASILWDKKCMGVAR